MRKSLLVGVVAAALTVPASASATTTPPYAIGGWSVQVPAESSSAWSESKRWFAHDRRLLVKVLVDGSPVFAVRGALPCRARTYGDVSVRLRLDCSEGRWRIMMQAKNLTTVPVRVRLRWTTLL